MTKAHAMENFRDYHLPYLENTRTARRCAWNDYVDQLQKQGDITAKQAETWVNPYDKN